MVLWLDEPSYKLCYVGNSRVLFALHKRTDEGCEKIT
jgi:hypothetical protein